jgi:hypothetical protein
MLEIFNNSRSHERTAEEAILAVPEISSGTMYWMYISSDGCGRGRRVLHCNCHIVKTA